MFAVACNSVALANHNDCFVERILWYYLANISKYFSMDFALTTLKLVASYLQYLCTLPIGNTKQTTLTGCDLCT